MRIFPAGSPPRDHAQEKDIPGASRPRRARTRTSRASRCSHFRRQPGRPAPNREPPLPIQGPHNSNSAQTLTMISRAGANSKTAIDLEAEVASSRKVRRHEGKRTPSLGVRLSDSPRARTARAVRHLRSLGLRRIRRIRKLRNRVLAIGAQLILVALQALVQLLPGLPGTHVLGVRFARPRDFSVFTPLFQRASLRISNHNKSTNQYEMCQFHEMSPST